MHVTPPATYAAHSAKSHTSIPTPATLTATYAEAYAKQLTRTIVLATLTVTYVGRLVNQHLPILSIIHVILSAIFAVQSEEYTTPIHIPAILHVTFAE